MNKMTRFIQSAVDGIASIWIVPAFILCCGVSALPYFASPGFAEQSQAPLSIVYFNSYHQGYKWSDDEQKGIQEAFKKKDFKRPVHFYVEYMDTKRIANDSYLEQLLQTYKEKYRGIHVDLILSSDNNAFNFLNAYRKDIFPDIPYVFCGVNYFEPGQINDPHHITGVNEAAGIRETLALIFSLHPQTKEVLIINDQTNTGIKVQGQLLKEVALWGGRARFEFTDNLTYPEILEKVKHLNEGSVILFTFFFRDVAGQFYKNSEVISRLKAVSRVPIYGTWDFNLGLGIVGGMLTSGYYQGQKAAEMAINVLSGEDIDQMPVVMESPNRYFFDYNLLEQYEIPISKLPKNSIVINAPETIDAFYEKHKPIVLSAVFIFWSTILVILLFSEVNIRRINRKLTLSEKRYRSIFEHTGTAMVIIEADTTISMANTGFEILSGYGRQDIEMKKNWQEFTHEADKKKMAAYHQKRRIDDKEAPLNYEFRFINKEGTERHVFVTVGMIQGTGQSVASLLDISGRIRIEKEKEDLITKLQHALDNIKTLKGLVPICSYCKKIRNDEGYWRQIEEFIQEHSDAQFSHGICPDCAKKYFPEYDLSGRIPGT